MTLYADPSALLRAYFSDEPDHEALRALLLEGNERVVTSELARIEVGGAIRNAARAGRLRRWRPLLARFEWDCGGAGPLTLLALRPTTVIARVSRLVLDHRLRTLDALHLAVALEEDLAATAGDEIVFVTRDEDQAAAAAALGLAVR